MIDALPVGTLQMIALFSHNFLINKTHLGEFKIYS